jgi:MFS family permease
MLSTLRHRDFALLWTAGLVSVAGDFALIVALSLHAFALTGSPAATGGVFAATLLPRILLGSVAGVFVDRWDRRRTMIAADLLRALLLLPLLAVRSPDLLWLLYLVRAATGTVGLAFDPAESALLPKLVGEERLVSANALNALNDNLGRLVGPALGGLLYASGGLTAVVLVDAGTFLASAALVALIRANARAERSTAERGEAAPWRRVAGEWQAGVQGVARDRTLSTILIGYGLGAVGDGTFGLGFTPLAIDVLRGGAAGAGLLLSAQAVGGLVAGAAVALVAARCAPPRLFAAGLIGLGLADLGLANAARLAPPGTAALTLGALCLAVAGFPVVAINAAGNGLVQTRTSDEYRGRVFGALGAALGLATLLGLVLGSAVVDAVGVVIVLSAGAAMWIAGGVVAMLRFREITLMVPVVERGIEP